MGIKNFYNFLNKFAPKSIEIQNIQYYKNSVIGIDFNLMLYKLILSIRKNGYDIINNGIIVTHIYALLLKLRKFRKYNINAVFVLDGKPPQIKYRILNERNTMRKKMYNKYKYSTSDQDKKKYFYAKSDITEKEFEECIELIHIFGYNVIHSPGEADAQLAFLSKKNLIDYVASDDSDILLFGAHNILKGFNVVEKKNIYQINLSQIKEELDCTQNDLIKLGILLGSDYCNNSNISINKAYKIMKNMDYSDVERECSQAINYFKHPDVDTNFKKFKMYAVDKHELVSFLNDYSFKQESIDKILDEL